MKRNKKILVLASTYPRWDNDSEARFVHNKAVGLSKFFDVVVLAPFFEGSKEYEVMDGVRIYRFRYWRERLCYGEGMQYHFKNSFLEKLSLVSFLFNEYKKLRWIVKHERINTLWGWWAFPQGTILWVNKLLHKQTYGLTLASSVSEHFKYFFIKKAISEAKWVVALSKALTIQTELHTSVRPQVIPIGSTFREASHKKYNNSKVLLCVGRLVPQKGFHYLIQNLPEGCSLRIAGEGFFKDELVKLSVGKPVEFLGPLNKEQLVKEYSNADLFILPSEPGTESLGLVSAEAIMCGCPVLARNTCGIPDLIIDGQTGYLFNTNEELKQKISWIFENYAEVLKTVDRGKKHIEDNFNPEKIVRKYMEVLNEN